MENETKQEGMEGWLTYLQRGFPKNRLEIGFPAKREPPE